MVIELTQGAPWTRKHDDPRTSYMPTTPLIPYPKTLVDLIDICRDGSLARPPPRGGQPLGPVRRRASDEKFIETHDYDNVGQAMGRTLKEVVPHCLHPDFLDRMSDPSFSRDIGGF
jgi:hypothetical protein